MRSCRICGLKLCLISLAMSVWAVLQLTLMGGFYYNHATTLAENIHLPENMTLTKAEDLKKFYKVLDERYEIAAMNCWMAAGMYAVVLLVSLQQFVFIHKCRLIYKQN
ncbi:hypothetical protein BDFB_004959 [Asbolus verrucosus]|uniref:Uncharacterized protein n=1 Tax=Asbolus verrucosus TaxID=1661398 RepID=A0A482VTN9_ASBVE|nr:hypothetical protein BDFB_004959 [Asbolus verrucosus]